MRQIRPLSSSDYHPAAIIFANAYPGLNLFAAEDRQRMVEGIKKNDQYPTVTYYGLFEEDGSGSEQMRGVMRYHDFQMKLLSASTLVGGIGGVAVELTRKKEKIARDMLLNFLHHYREKAACMAVLYPFRSDFYRKMGFGIGAKMSQYRLKPADLPKKASKANVVFLQESDKAALHDCYNRFRDKTNGLFEMDERTLNSIFESTTFQAVGVKRGSLISGYIVFKFRQLDPENFLRHEMVVRDFVYETPEALWQLLTFLHSQADQVERIEFNSPDEHFDHLFPDPRDDSGELLFPVWHQSNVQGTGIMYRVIDTSRLFEVLANHDFGGQSCRLKITLEDSFLPENAGSTFIYFQDGRAQLDSGEDYDVAIELDVSDFSSMIVGAITFERLYTYGLARISDDRFVWTVNRLFQVAHKPMCFTPF